MFHFAHTFRVLLLLLGPLFVHCAMGSPFMDDDDEAEADSDCLHAPLLPPLLLLLLLLLLLFHRQKKKQQPTYK